MTKRKSRSMVMALALSLIVVVGLLPVTATAAGKPEIKGIAVWVDNRTTPYPWAPPHVIVEGEPMYVAVEASYTDGSTGYLSAAAVDFAIVGGIFAIRAEDTGAAPGQILLEPQQPLPTHWFSIKASLRSNPEISSVCSVQVDELVVCTVVVGQENQPPVLKRGQSVQLSFEVYPKGSESKLIWEDWQKDFPDGKIGTDSHISKDGRLYIGWNETETTLDIAPPISNKPQTARFSISIPTIKVEAATPPHTHTPDGGIITKNATCTEAGVKTFTCTSCKALVRTEAIAKLGHSWNSGVITSPATQEKEGVKTFTCTRCGGTHKESIPKLPVTPGNGNARFLQARADRILQDGLSKDDLRLDGKTLTLVLDGRSFILSTNAKNRNISGEISLGDGYYLRFDIKGNGSNVKEFKVIQK